MAASLELAIGDRRNKMKLNKHNYELVMFDLLEGNLSQSDELRVMKQIEEDEFFFKEWKLFKSTILVADSDIVYSNKSALLKKEYAIVLIYKPWMAVAAGVTLLAMVFVLWPSAAPSELADMPTNKPEEATPLVSLPAIDDLTQNEEVTTLLTDNTPNMKEQEPNNVGAKSSDESSKIRLEQVVHDAPASAEQEAIITPESSKTLIAGRQEIDNARKAVDERQLDKHYNDEHKKEEETPASQQIAKGDDVKLNIEMTPIPEAKLLEENSRNEAIASTENQTSKEKISAFVTNSPLERITSITLAVAAKARHPKVRLKPNFKRDSRPSLDIEFESDGYQAIASLQPFKK